MWRRFGFLLLVVLVLGSAACNRGEHGESSEAFAPTASTQPEVAASPELPLEDFLGQASLEVVLRFPETITQLGIGSWIGARDDALTPQTRAYELETAELLESLLAELRRYDLSSVSPSTALSARVYGWYLEDLLDAHLFSDHIYPVSTHISNYTDSLERLFSRVHPMRTIENVEDYLLRLRQIATRIDELIARLDENANIHALPPNFILSEAAANLQQSADVPATESVYYTSFCGRLDGIEAIGAVQKQAMEEEAEGIVRTSVLPAYARLADHVRELAAQVDDAIGVWRHEDGDDYYAYCLRKYTTTDLTAKEIHNLGLAEVARIRQETRAAASDLGIEDSGDLAALFDQLVEDYGQVTGSELVGTCEGLIGEISSRVRSAFSNWPQADIIVVEGTTSAFFSPGALDGSRPGMFYAPVARQEPMFSLPTLVYHEAIPGHGLQTSFAREADLPSYRAGLGISAYAEGWALYAERLAWEMGAYEDNPVGNLGRLQAELWRAVRLVVDTGIHAMRWTYDQAVDYMRENTGLDRDFVQQEIQRYIVDPGQACAYKIGMLKFLELRKRAQDALGDAFDLAAFHQAVLQQGDVPLFILEELVDAYIEESV